VTFNCIWKSIFPLDVPAVNLKVKLVKHSSPLAVAFAPDWTQGNPYQAHLQESLQEEQVSVRYIQPREWGFPLAESAARGEVRLIHLHWPEAFFNKPGRLWRIWTRKVRYAIDLQRAAASCPLVLTAHNLYPHDRRNEPLVRPLIRMTYAKARAIIAHSAAAALTVQREFGVSLDKLHVIPHGSWCEDAPPQARLSIFEARAKLGIEKDASFCLIYGLIAKYKGIEEVICFWKAHSPDCDLRIVGSPKSLTYLQRLEKLIEGHPRIHLHPKWYTNDEIMIWLMAANCVLFNYAHILTSGAAIQARAHGIPILLPRRLSTLDLGEPHPLVTRFESFDLDFESALQTALGLHADDSQADEFRKQTSWTQVARATARLYRSILEN
jgi:glycosyltransferase involved in cell wall biosynthesis